MRANIETKEVNLEPALRTNLFAALLVCSLLSLLTNEACGQQKVNIVQIIADDLGWVDVSVNSTNNGNASQYYQTPNLESLAAGGMSFSSAYVLPACAPTRAAIFTGQYPPRNGVLTVGSLDSDNGLLDAPDNSSAIQNNAMTIAELLQGAGYVTAHIGKFHVTGFPNQILAQHGFDFNIGGSSSGAPNGTIPYFAEEVQPGNWDYGTAHGPELDQYASPYTQAYIDSILLPFANNNDPSNLVSTPKHLNDAMGDAAIDFLSDRISDGQPFFVNVAFNAVHVDINSRSDLEAKYQGIAPTNMPDHDSPVYAGLLEGMDQAIGRVIQLVENSNLAGNTLILFVSDNGAVGNLTDNFPLSGSKGSFREGGIRVPMIAYLPGMIEAGSISDEAVHAVDLYKTYAELANVELPDPVVHALDGESLKDLVTGNQDSLIRTNIYNHFPGYGQENPHSSAIHDAVDGNRYKLSYFYEDRSFTLFDLTNDISESTDLLRSGASAPQYIIASCLSNQLREWASNWQADFPIVKATGNPVPNIGHTPEIRFDLGTDGLGIEIVGLNMGTVDQLGVAMTLQATGLNSEFGLGNTGTGVLSDLDTGSTANQRRIDGTLTTPEKVNISFDRDVVLKYIELSQFNGDNIESLVLELVSGASPFQNLIGYQTDGFSLQDDRLSYIRPAGGNQSFEVRLGVLDKDELLLAAGTTISITADPATSGGFTISSIGVAIPDFVPADVNRDGIVNLLDVSPFIGLLGSTSYAMEGDVNKDGVINLLDVVPFVQKLSGN